MAKNISPKASLPPGETLVTQAVEQPAAPIVLPQLGTSCVVKAPAGVSLMNNETGRHFVPEVHTPVTTTITLLRRLKDGDLILLKFTPCLKPL